MDKKQDFSNFIEKMLQEEWPKDAIDRAVENITENTPNSNVTISDFRRMVMAAEGELEEEQVQKEKMNQRRQEEKARALERERLMQERIREEQSSSPTIETEITNYLRDSKNVHAVSAREVADCLYKKLTESEQAHYFNKPLFAAREMIGTDTFDASLRECIQKYQKSVIIQNKINAYLDEVTPARDKDDQQIDKLIESLPDSRKTMDDRMYQAYTAICWLEEEKNKDEEEVTVEEIKNDPEFEREFTASVAAEVNRGEPYEVAYRSGFERVTGAVFKKAGNIRSIPRHYKEVAKEALELGDRETLGDNIYEKVQHDKELKALLDERDAEYERKLKELEERQNKNYPQQNYGYSQPQSYGYKNNSYGYGYGNNMQNRMYNQSTMPFAMKIAFGHFAVGALLLLVAFLFKSPTTFSALGSFAAGYGFMQKSKNDKNSLIWILVGYAAIIVPIILM